MAKKNNTRDTNRVSRAHAREDARPTPAAEAAEDTRLKKLAFLAAYAGCGRITKAAKAAGIDQSTHFLWMKSDPDYKKSFVEAREQVVAILEDEAIRRAVEGVTDPLIGRVARDKDGVVATRAMFSDRLLELLLKGNNPDVYRERREITGKNGGPLALADLTGLTDEQLDDELARLEAREAGTPTGESPTV